MYQAEISELHNLFLSAQQACKFAHENYPMLAGRQHTYALYGGDSSGLGVEIPSLVTPVRSRKLLPKRRSREYTIYHLDDNFEVLRTSRIIGYTRVDYIYHHFQIDGVRYAVPYHADHSLARSAGIAAMHYRDGKPFCYSLKFTNLTFTQFYEYTSEDSMIVSTYRYWPFTRNNVKMDWNAEPGSPSYPLQSYWSEQTPHFVDFRQLILPDKERFSILTGR